MGGLTRLSYTELLRACARRERMRQFSLASLRGYPITARPFVPASSASGPSSVRLSRAARRRVFYTRFSWAGASGHLLPAPVSWSPKLVRNFLGVEWGRRRHCSLQRPVTAAPAQLHACGYRSLTLLATESVGLAGPQVSMQRGWQPQRTVQWQVLSPLVLAAHEVCAV